MGTDQICLFTALDISATQVLSKPIKKQDAVIELIEKYWQPWKMNYQVRQLF